MTAPSDFLDLFRWEEEGGSVERTEENWDEPRVDRSQDDDEEVEEPCDE